MNILELSAHCKPKWSRLKSYELVRFPQTDPEQMTNNLSVTFVLVVRVRLLDS